MFFSHQKTLITILGICIVVFHTQCNTTGSKNTDTENNRIAFPEAIGAGMNTTGGREGNVVYVENLNDSGEGSLRAALKMRGSRIVVFKVAGDIFLESELKIRSGNLTIAGQSAPGEGISIHNYPIIIQADNVIIRYIRVRLGDKSKQALDAINCKNQNNIIIDHCSFSWAIDEVASFYDNENFTLQWCIISESLNSSYHPKGPHGYGGIWGGKGATFHHNLFIHHKSRNPRLNGSRYHKEPDLERASFINNVVYNYSIKCVYGGEEGGYNIIANYFVPGPSTSKKASNFFLEPYRPYGKFYVSENILYGNSMVSENNNNGVRIHSDSLSKVLNSKPFTGDHYFEPEEASVAYRKVLDYAGASSCRDTTDKRLIAELKNKSFHYGENGIINSLSDIGEFPYLESKKSEQPDTDNDGMPDAWELKNNLDPKNPNDNKTYILNKSYTNIEVYLNTLVD